MRLHPVSICLSAGLAFTLLACQPPEQFNDLNATAKVATASQNSPYLFTGAPGIRNSTLDDISGTMVGSIDGQPINFGPDQEFPLQVLTGFNPNGNKATILGLQARNTQFSVSMYFNGPFEAGRDYKIYDPSVDNGELKFDPYIVIPYIRVPAGQIGRDILNVADPNNRVRITAITPEYVNIEFFFTLKKEGAVQERLNIRIKNLLNENLNLRAQSEGEPFWDYTNAIRRIESWGYVPNPASSPNNFLSPPTVTRVQINQSPLTVPVSDFTYEEKTELAQSQSISLYRTRAPQEQTYIEYSSGTNYSATGWKRVEIVWPNFTGVGIYTGDQVNISFINSLANNDYWRIAPYRLASTTTKWQVNVQRVTADVIEGTYTVVDAPILEKKGTTNIPATASVSGKFTVIYPR